ncbi:hypothetical protein [Arenimonas sp.]|uniref:hypothetical protein n=1 Tax=Arenimonas sp. TaxID=1872635 RepID=UPI0039E266FF
MSAIFFLILGLAVAFGAWVFSRRLVADEAQGLGYDSDTTQELPVVTAPLARPVRVADPVAAAGKGLGQLWQLQSNGTNCSLSRQFGPRRLPTSETVPLAQPHCRRIDCQCYYQPVPEQRKRARRDGEDRRELFRVTGTKPERRLRHERRRSGMAWEDSRFV